MIHSPENVRHHALSPRLADDLAVRVLQQVLPLIPAKSFVRPEMIVDPTGLKTLCSSSVNRLFHNSLTGREEFGHVNLYIGQPNYPVNAPECHSLPGNLCQIRLVVTNTLPCAAEPHFEQLFCPFKELVFSQGHSSVGGSYTQPDYCTRNAALQQLD